MRIKNQLTGDVVLVKSTTNHPSSSYGKAVWVDRDNQAICQVGLEEMAGYTLIDDRMALGVQLKAIRVSKQISKYEMSKGGMISRTTIDAIEAGSMAYAIDSLLFYCSYVGIKTLDIID